METQRSISAWCEATFGPVSSDIRVAARANEEMAELLEKLATDPAHKGAAEEVADVVIVLARLATRLGLDTETVAALEPADGATPALAAALANRSMAATLRALAMPNHAGPEFIARGHLACLVASLKSLAAVMGFDLQEEIDRKMDTNRHKRTWKLDGSGHGYHVREGRGRDE